MPEEEEDDKSKGGMSPDEVRAFVASVMAQNRGAAELEKYLEQNLTLRRKNSDLREEVKTLKTKVPADGSLVLTGDDLVEHNALVALGKKAKDIKATLDSHDELLEKTSKLERAQLVAQIAEAEGWKAPLLDRLTQGMDLALEDVNEDVEDADGGTKKAQVKHGFVQKKDGTTVSKVRLDEELKDLLTSLAKEPEDAGKETDGQGDLTTFPKQVRGQTGKKPGPDADLKGAVGKHIGSRYVTPGKEAAAKQ